MRREFHLLQSDLSRKATDRHKALNNILFAEKFFLYRIGNPMAHVGGKRFNEIYWYHCGPSVNNVNKNVDNKDHLLMGYYYI